MAKPLKKIVAIGGKLRYESIAKREEFAPLGDLLDKSRPVKAARSAMLVYGFRPFLNYRENITEKVVRCLKDRKGLVKVVLPVRFRKETFLRPVKKFRPAVVLGMGQCPGSGKIRIERRAVNLKGRTGKGKQEAIPEGRSATGITICKNRPGHLRVNWLLRGGREVAISRDAGRYVCNFSMYVLADYARKNDMRYAFIHIPQRYPLRKAVRYVEGVIERALVE